MSETYSIEQLEAALAKTESRHKVWKWILRCTAILIVVSAVSVLLVSFYFPVYRITGASMEPRLNDGDLVIGISAPAEKGKIEAFWHENNLLVKRCIAGPSQTIDKNDDGVVTVDGEAVVGLKADTIENSGIALPYHVGADSWFVLGENTGVSVDSRSDLGCVNTDKFVGKVIFRFWPLNALGPIN